jgi:hypothetical protein
VKKISEMTTQEHVERAQSLVQHIDAQFDDNGAPTAHWAVKPVALDLAQMHLFLAFIKEEEIGIYEPQEG